MGNLELLCGDFQAACSHFKQILADDPDNIEALCSIADAEHRQYNYQEAEAYLQHAYKLAPENSLVHYSLALLYRDQSKKLDKAVKHMRKAIDLQQTIQSINCFTEIFWLKLIEKAKLKTLGKKL